VIAPALKYLPLLLAGLLPGLVQATTLLELDAQEGGQKGRAAVAIQDGLVRIDQGAGGWMVYDSSKNSVSVVDTQRRSYFELTRDEMRVYGKQLGTARKMLDEQLPGMLPEQRAAIEKMLGGTARKNPLLFQSTGQKRQVAGFSCTGGRLVRNGKVQEEVCLAAHKDIGMPDNDYATVRNMYRLMHEMQELGAPGILPDFSEIDGVPIEVRNPNGDFQRVNRITHEQLPATTFTVPADYTRDNVVDALQRYR
jgi:hypothetical protein